MYKAAPQHMKKRLPEDSTSQHNSANKKSRPEQNKSNAHRNKPSESLISVAEKSNKQKEHCNKSLEELPPNQIVQVLSPFYSVSKKPAEINNQETNTSASEDNIESQKTIGEKPSFNINILIKFPTDQIDSYRVNVITPGRVVTPDNGAHKTDS